MTTPAPNLQMRDALYRQGLESLCRRWLDSTFVAAEIGVFAGEGSAILSRHVARLICIDPWDPAYETEILEGCANASLAEEIRSGEVSIRRAEAAFDAVRRDRRNIVKIAAFDDQVVGLFSDGAFDAIYIDAAHTPDAVTAQLAAWLPKVRPGGCIAGHDYSPDWPGVVEAVTSLIGAPDEVFEDTSWVKRVGSG